jgi:hypothetical protein
MPTTTTQHVPPADEPKHPLHALTTYELRDYRRQLENAIADQRHAAMMTAHNDHHRRIVQLAPRELDLYGNQLARVPEGPGNQCPDPRRHPA